MKNKLFCIGLSLVAFLATHLCLNAEPVVVANKKLSAETINTDTLKAVFMGKKVGWDSTSTRVVVVLLKEGPTHEAFVQAVAGQSGSQFSSYWRRLFMTGGGSAPKIFETEAELVKFVAATDGAIGYTDAANAGADVLVIPVAK
ncbi:MAG: hypothetical protein SFY80_17335 [Verrucomicrobiota bacterium]|nr:hypothetical protein [Verrucomicrobiota bacterium]